MDAESIKKEEARGSQTTTCPHDKSLKLMLKGGRAYICNQFQFQLHSIEEVFGDK